MREREREREKERRQYHSKKTHTNHFDPRGRFLFPRVKSRHLLFSGSPDRFARSDTQRNFVRVTENLDDKWKELSEKAERPLEALANQAEQLRHVTNVNINETENSVDGETQERLIFKILMGIENEITILLDILTQFNDTNQDLKNYLVNLENARSQVSLKDETMQELIKGTSYRPTLNLLLEWAMEGFQFYNNMYLSIRDCMKSIDYKREETIDDLISSFVEDQRGRRNINKILAFTQFLAKETLH